MKVRIALAGNPNSGKTTLFNALTGANQFVGNWPGVTVEKKEGKFKKDKEVVITDLPGIYSLSPYTPEEIIARNYLIEEKPDVILNIVDGSNLERNLYLTTQLAELGIPMVVAVNMVDVVRKNGDFVDVKTLSERLGCPFVEISALKGEGVFDAARKAIGAANEGGEQKHITFEGEVETAVNGVCGVIKEKVDSKLCRWYGVKLLENDIKAVEGISLSADENSRINAIRESVEESMDDDAESIITNARYEYITKLTKDCYKKSNRGKMSTSDKIDSIVTNRFLALPIFAAIMALVYFISITTVGTLCTNWVNDGVFGDGWHLFGNGTGEYEEAMNEYAKKNLWADEFVKTVESAEEAGITGADEIKGAIKDGDFSAFNKAYETYGDALSENGFDLSESYEAALGEEAEGVPDTSEYGIWVPSIPALAESALEKLGTADWLNSLILDGIIGGVGAVLGFVPQMIVLFIMLAFLESCGYMARVAFVMDRIFRRFGLSGKSFIPMLISTGCGVPGIMAARTIENEKDRRMTVMTATFMPCGAKLPIIAMISTALFGGSWLITTSAYFLGMAAIVVSGIMLKKTKMFAGDPAPFVMELPAYHWPTVGNVARSVWERSWSFIKKAGTIILLASIVIWAGSKFGMEGGRMVFSTEMELESSILGYMGKAIMFVFAPLGFADIKATVATIMGLVAKEEVVGVFGVLDFAGLSRLAAYSFLAFNLLCAPCFAAIGAIRREMNSAKWTWFAILYQCGLAYAVSLMIYQFGLTFTGKINFIGLAFAAAVCAAMVYMLFIKKERTDK